MTPSQVESHQGPAPVSRAFWCCTTFGAFSAHKHSRCNVFWWISFWYSVTGILVQYTVCIDNTPVFWCSAPCASEAQHQHSGTERHTSRAHSVARSFYALNTEHSRMAFSRIQNTEQEKFVHMKRLYTPCYVIKH